MSDNKGAPGRGSPRPRGRAKFTPTGYPHASEAKEFYSKRKPLDPEGQLTIISNIWGDRKGWVALPWIPGTCETNEVLKAARPAASGSRGGGA
jgi:hypothetical protein